MVNGRRLTFDVWGLDRDVFLMRDRQTGTIWAHLDGAASSGPLAPRAGLAGSRLKMLPVPLMTWGQWKAAYPQTLVLSPDTPYSQFYRQVRLGVFEAGEARFGDGRLPSNALVVGVEVGREFRAYPIDVVAQAGGVLNDVVNGEPVVVFFNPATQTGIAFSRRVDGVTLEFEKAPDGGFNLRDRASGSRWDVAGRAVDGPLAGKLLTFVPSFITEWYGWSAYHPASSIYQALP